MRSNLTIPQNIVVRGTNWVGDTIISLPALCEVRRIFPEASVSVWVPKSLGNLVSATGVPDSVITFDKRDGGSIRRSFTMAARLRRRRFDAAFLFQNAFESAFTSWLAAVPVRAGFPTDMRGAMLNVRVPLREELEQKHQVYYYLAITDYLEAVFFGKQSRPTQPPDCSILMAPKTLEKARDLLMSHGAGLDKPLYCLCPGSVNSEAKRWPAPSFAKLADLLIERWDAHVVFLGTSSERVLTERIESLMQQTGSVNLAGKTDMVESMAVMGLSRAVVSNDTGSAHLAVASSAKVLTIFGPTNPEATAPFGPNAFIIRGSAPCAPCRYFRCSVDGHPCMTSVTPDAVFERLNGILSVKKPSDITGVRSSGNF